MTFVFAPCSKNIKFWWALGISNTVVLCGNIYLSIATEKVWGILFIAIGLFVELVCVRAIITLKKDVRSERSP